MKGGGGRQWGGEREGEMRRWVEMGIECGGERGMDG